MNLARDETSGHRLTSRNPHVAQYLGVSQHEISYSNFGVTENVDDDPYEKENMCPQKPPTRRKKAELKKPVKKAKATDQILLPQITWITKSETTESRPSPKSAKFHVEDSETVQSTISEPPAEVCLSARTLKILDSFKYHPPSEPRCDNVETSDAHRNPGPSTTMDALRATQDPNGLTLYSGSVESSSTDLLRPCNVSSTPKADYHFTFTSAVDLLNPIPEEEEPPEVPRSLQPGKTSTGTNACEEDNVQPQPISTGQESELSDAFDDLPDDDLLTFASESGLLDVIQRGSDDTSLTTDNVQSCSSGVHNISDTAPSSDVPQVFNSDKPSNFEEEWLQIEEFEEVDKADLIEPGSDHPTIAPLVSPGPVSSVKNVATPQKKAGGTTNGDSADSVELVITAAEYTDNILHPPIVRSAFPQPIRDRSPIIGISASKFLRTCFRVGEALREGCQAARCNKDVVLELFAKVDSSWREASGVKQHFVLSDLFHDRPPRIEAVYEWWNANELWAYDSGRFLGPEGSKRLCRCIGKMRREKNAWKMVILNIWEATWDDVEYIRGIICAW